MKKRDFNDFLLAPRGRADELTKFVSNKIFFHGMINESSC